MTGQAAPPPYHPRFHYPMLPAFALLAAAGLVAAASWARSVFARRTR